MADRSGGSDTDLMAAYKSRVDPLWDLARELGIPRREAARLIREALYSSLFRKDHLDTNRFLAASLRSAAKRRTERAK
jgi:hypothetical protein